MYHEEHVGKARPKVHAIDVVMSRGLWRVDVTALGAVELDHALTRHV